MEHVGATEPGGPDIGRPQRIRDAALRDEGALAAGVHDGDESPAGAFHAHGVDVDAVIT